MGLSWVCPKCGGVTRPGDRPVQNNRSDADQLSPKRVAARTASRILFVSLIAIPVVGLFLLFVVFPTADDPDLPEKAFKGLTSGTAILIVVLTQYAHRRRDAAAKEDGKPYWENLF
ncbi:MAG: hypothetical protein ABGZ23_24050 [Fuerstiella sp.]|nr:hypothetical protein [Fuerstiella sp.]